MLDEHIDESIKNVGAEETAVIISQALCYMAQSLNDDYEFSCDLGKVTVERKKLNSTTSQSF